MTGDWKEGSIEGVEFREAVKRADQRGWLAEIFRSDEMPPDMLPMMSYVSVTLPGVTRGPHMHNSQTDVFGFFGPGCFSIRLWDDREESATRGNMITRNVGERNPMIVVVPPGIVHGYTNISDIEAWVLNFPNRLFAGPGRGEPVDEVRYENMADHPFSMES